MCPHNDCIAIWEEMHHYFKHGIQATYHNLLTYGLQEGCQAPTMDPFTHLLNPHCIIYQAQHALGWTQLYYGHMSLLWVTEQNKHHPTVNGLHYYMTIWKAVLKTWHLRNHHLHLQNPNHKAQLRVIVNQLII